MSPTARSLAHLREMGFTVAITEHFNVWTKRRVDLFGGLDAVALHPARSGVLGLQFCASGDHAKRRAKLLALPAIRLWLQSGNPVWVMSWGKKGARGKRKVWTCRIEALTVADMDRNLRALVTKVAV